MKKFKIEGRTTCNLNTYSFGILIMSPRRLFNSARVLSSTSFSKQTSLKSSTCVTHFLPKYNKVQKLGIVHQGYFCTLFRGISRAPTISKMELFVTLLNAFQPLTNVMKNPILDVMGVLYPSLLLYIKILFQNIDNECMTNWMGNRRSSWKALWIKKVPVTYLKGDPGVCGQNP